MDYDIVYIVNDVAPFYKNLEWINKCFSNPAVMQMPEDMRLISPKITEALFI